MDIEVKIKPVKVNDKDVHIGDERRLTFAPTWNSRGRLVDITGPDGITFTVCRDSVERALRACAEAKD